ncbi:bile acid:sodium symporter [Candidatus Peregrinibacteria bacterium]|nr:bile acid:sodium symporter [Candidatus Peregrinibacteria bacterium]
MKLSFSQISSFLEQYFWIVFFLGFLLGIFFPEYGKNGIFVLNGILFVILFLVFFRIDTSEVLRQVKKPILLIYLTILFLIVFPVAVFLISEKFFPDFALALLLISAVPPGVSTPVLTDFVKGNIPLSLAILVIQHLVLPFTLPPLFFLLSGVHVEIPLMDMFQRLVILIFLPILAAEICKKIFPPMFSKTIRTHGKSINIIFLFFLFYFVAAPYSEYFFRDFSGIWKQLLLLFPLFLIFHCFGYFSYFWGNFSDKVTVSISKTYMNNGIAIVLAANFFPPEVVFFAVLSEFPWILMMFPFRWIVERTKEKLNKN